MSRVRTFTAAQICLLALVLIWSCNDYPRIGFPVVFTDEPVYDTAGALVVTLEGRVQLEEEFLPDITRRGFVISTETTEPEIGFGTVIDASTIDGLQFSAEVDTGLSYETGAYFVRAFVQIEDEKRNTVFYDEGFRAFTFSTHLRVLSISGLTEVRNDTADVTGLIDSRFYDVNELVLQYGHIFSKDSTALIGSDSVIVELVATDTNRIESDIANTVTRLEYNQTFFFRTVAITDVDTIYSDLDSFRIRGGYNKVTSIPDTLRSGVVATDGNTAYAGIGRRLYKVTRPEDGPFDALIWDTVPSPDDPGNGRQFTGRNWEGGIAFISQDSFYYMWGATPGNRNIINALSLMTGEWSVRSPLDIKQGVSTLPLASRRDAIAFVLNENDVFLGFGLQNNPMIRRNSLFQFFPARDSIATFCDPCLAFNEGISGQVAGIINGDAYIATGVTGSINSPVATTDLYRFDPSDTVDPFKVLNPMPGPERQNALSFVLGNRLYVGMGSRTDELIVLPDICYYDVETGFWSLVREPFPGKPRTNAISFVLDGRVYFGGGADGAGNPLDDMWTYTPPTN